MPVQLFTAYIDYTHDERNKAERADISEGGKHICQWVWSAVAARKRSKIIGYVREVVIDAHEHVDAVGVDEAGRAVVWRQ